MASTAYNEIKRKLIASRANNASVEEPGGNTGRSKQYTAIQKKIQSGGFSTSMTSADVENFLHDSQSFMEQSAKEYAGLSWTKATSGDYQAKRKATSEDLTARTAQVRSFLNANRSRFDPEVYENYVKHLEKFSAFQAKSSRLFDTAFDGYGEYETEDAYNQAIERADAAIKNREDMLAFDLDAGEREIRELQSLVDEYDQLILRQSTADPLTDANVRLREIRSQYGSKEDIKRQISEKTAYVNRVKRFREGEQLASVVDNADFDDYKGYVSTVKAGEIGTPVFGDETYEYINNPTVQYRMLDGPVESTARSLIDTSHTVYNWDNPFDDGKSRYEEANYSYMESNEIDIYNYYYAKYGKEAAEKYLDSIQETLNYRKAVDIYKNVEDNVLLEMAFGAAAGLDQFESGVKNLFNFKDNYISPSAVQMASGMVREDLQGKGPQLPEWLGGASLGQATYDTVTTTANMLPSILASAAVSVINPVAGQITGATLMGASAAGNAYQEMLNLGYDKGQARCYSSLVGASEAGLQYLLGGIEKLGGKLTGNALSKVLNNVDNIFARIAIKLGGNVLPEGMEEGLQEILTPWFKKIALHVDEDVQWDQVAYSSLLGSMTAFFMEGPGSISNEVKTYQTGKKLQSSEFSPQRLADVGKSFAADTVAYQLADKVNENTDAYTIGRLFKEIGATLTEQNVSDITQALVERGMDATTARKNAEAMAIVVEGGNLSDLQVAIIEANEVLAEAVRTTIIDSNASWFQRSKGYNEALMALAQEKVSNEATTKHAQQDGENASTVETQPITAQQTNSADSDTVSTSEEIAPEPQYEVSVDNQTIQKSTGEAVALKEISSIKNGKMTFRTDAGTEVDAADVSYASEDEAIVYETVAQLCSNASAANLLVDAFHTGQIPGDIYARGIQEAYSYGKFNISQDDMMKHGSYVKDLTEHQRNVAYKMGQLFAGKQISREVAAIRKHKKSGQKVAGKVHFDGDRSKLNATQRAGLDAMELLAKGLGIQFYVFESDHNADGDRAGKNGRYDPKDGSIHIDLHAGNDGKGTILFTVAHELTHYIRQWSPAKFKILANYLIKQYGEKGVPVNDLIDDQITKAARDNRTIDRDEAFEEMVADSMESMLTSGNVLQMMADVKAQDRALWEKIRDWFKDFAEKLKKIINAYSDVEPDSVEGRLVADMQDVTVILEALYGDALLDAAENFDAETQKNTAVGGVKYQAKRGELAHYKRPITVEDILVLRSIGRKSINQFTTEDLNKAEKWAYKFYKELGVKSPFFRSWFGDWRANSIDPAEIVEFTYGEKNKINYRKRTVKNRDMNGKRIAVDDSVIDDSVHYAKQNGDEKQIKKLLTRIDEILEKGILLDTQISVKSSGNKKGSTQFMHYLYTPISINGAPFIAKSSVEEYDLTSKTRVYNLRRITLSALSRAQFAEIISQNRGKYAYSADALSVAQLFDFVKQNDSDFQPNPPSCVVNEDGTPKIMYHGTNANWTEYELSKNVNQAWGEGIYLAETAERARLYGDHVKALYVKALYNNRDAKHLGAERDHIRMKNGDILVFSPNQIKSATDNIGTFDGSKQNIHYSSRDPAQQKIQKALEQENAQLKEDVSRLEELLKLQRTVTGGTKFTKTSVEAAARMLKKHANVKRMANTSELAQLLHTFYEAIASDTKPSWDKIKEQARPVVQWLQDHVDLQAERSEYAQTILDQIKGSRIYLDESQRAEAEYRFGSYNDFRKAMLGRITFVNEGSTSLDSWWHAMADQFPDVFNPDTTSTDMPGELYDIVDQLKNADTSRVEYEYNRASIAMDLTRQVYDSYWRVSTLHTVADRAQDKINELRYKHYRQMTELRTEKDATIAQIKAENRAALAAHRAKAEKKQREIVELYQESRARAVDSRKRTEMRHQLRRVVKDIYKLYNRGKDTNNVKEEMKDFVFHALSSAELLLDDLYTDDDMIRNGVGIKLSTEANALLNRAKKILYRLDNPPAVSSVAQLDEWNHQEKKLKLDLSKIKTQLREAFLQERRNRKGDVLSIVMQDLCDAYEELANSKQPHIRNAFRPFVLMHLEGVRKNLKETRVEDMTLEQLTELHEAYTMVLTSIRDANKAFCANRSIDYMAKQLIREFGELKRSKSKVKNFARNVSDYAGWNYEKLYYALERIGSATFTQLFTNLANAENIIMEDIADAKAYQKKTVDKYGYNSWDINKKVDREFVDNLGHSFQLTLGEIMLLYAYTRRGNVWKQLATGGFVLEKKSLTDDRNVTAYKLTPAQCLSITNTLTEDQKHFVEDMQKYLSDVMGAKGNEVSMQLYGVKLYNDPNYCPVHIAGQYQARAEEATARKQSGFEKLSNAGFTKTKDIEAKATIAMESFMDIWVDHVNEMSRYHGAVPALEDIRRVMNYSDYSDGAVESKSVRAMMENRYGKQAVNYFDNLWREVNSGAVLDKLQSLPKKALSISRKMAVAYSLSVLVQQPSSISRAFAMVDPQYFAGLSGAGASAWGVAKTVTNRWSKKQTVAYAEMVKYAPGVTLAKEIGGFDASGGGIRNYLIDTEKNLITSMKTGTTGEKVKAVGDFIDDNPIANLPNLADKIAWIEIWNACKREVKDRHRGMDANGDAFMKLVGRRFTEVIRATQVYDSVFAKSPLLKSKNMAVQYIVSYMNEPNVVANMLESSIRDIRNGGFENFKKGAKKLIAVTRSIIFCNVLKSLIYAMRDDDEDETYIEKYMQALVGNLISDITVINYIPFLRDLWSICKGYDVERPDISIFSDLIFSIEKYNKVKNKDISGMSQKELEEWDRQCTEADWGLIGAIAGCFGIPIKNIYREIDSAFSCVRICGENAGKSTWKTYGNACYQGVVDALPWVRQVSKSDTLYDALATGDTATVNRLKSTYRDKDGNFNQSAYHSAVRKGLRKNDIRIQKAARARIAGDNTTANKLMSQIVEEGFFDYSDISAAVKAEYNDLKAD